MKFKQLNLPFIFKNEKALAATMQMGANFITARMAFDALAVIVRNKEVQ